MTIAVEIVLEPEFLARMGIGAVEIPHLTGRSLSLVLVFLIFVVIYRLAPYVKVQWRQVLPGAFLAALLFELGKSAFEFYVDRWAHFEAIYGPLTSTIVLLLWLYASDLILILGAEYNVVFWKSRTAASATLQR
jgi:membrane protein